MILLDTNALLWLLAGDRRLSKRAKAAIEGEETKGVLAISVVTLYEVAQLVKRGRIEIKTSIDLYLERVAASFSLRQITPLIAVKAADMPAAYPRDPMGRIIGATAWVEGLPLVSADEAIRGSNVAEIIW